MLIEELLALFILGSLSLTLFTLNMTPLKDRTTALIGLQTLQWARLTAISTDQDFQLTATQIQWPQLSNRSLSEVEVPHLNVPAIGFKPSGNTQRAGTFLIGHKPFRLTVSVGYGKVRLY